MSRKIDAFRQALGNPLTVHNFVVRLASVSDQDPNVEVIVQSTTLPSDQLQDVLLHYLGENVKFPTIPSNGGEWAVNIPDNEEGIAFVNTLKARKMWYEPVTGRMVSMNATGKNIEVVMRTVNDDEVYKVVLHNCYCKGRDPQQLNAATPTQALTFNQTFSYDWLEDLGLVDESGNPAQE